MDFFKETEYKIKDNYNSGINSDLRNNQDLIGSIENKNINEHHPYYPNINNNINLGLAFNTPTLSTEKEIRKIIEREIEPFIFSAKNEFRLNIENFQKDIADYKHFESELRNVRETVHENKKLILINQEENDRKINDNIDFCFY